MSYLTQPDLFLFESNVDSFAAAVDVDRLSDSLQTGRLKVSGAPAGLMWLLAHFIVLQKSRKQLVLHSRSLRVLYTLLSALSNQIREGFAALDPKPASEVHNGEEDLSPLLPSYVFQNLASLTDRDEISGLLEKFTT